VRPSLTPCRLTSTASRHASGKSLEAVESEPAGPGGAHWVEGTNLLVKLVAWASWGLFLADLGVQPPRDAEADEP
jgi:hypothetical protein